MKTLRVIIIVIAAIGITALGIDAADTLKGSEGTLLSQLSGALPEGECPKGMMPIVGLSESRCIDIYEASTNDDCPITDPRSILESTQNTNVGGCAAESKAEALPWRYVTRAQAETACARAGKRLPSSEEWYRAALGTPDGAETVCNIESGDLLETRDDTACISASGAYDMIGNVWEWVADDVEGKRFGDVVLPESGYVTSVDAKGTPRAASSSAAVEFNADYMWSRDEDALHGIIRGGFYDSGSDAGVYAFHAGTLPTTPGVAIGFRCVQ